MSSESERDRSVEQLLRHSLGSSAREYPPGSCPDAETLAAWVDGTLTATQTATADAHVADCVRCQALVASVVRTQPDAPTAESWWHGWLRTRWLVPVAATIAAVAIWVAVPRDQFSRLPQRQATQEAEPEQSIATEAPTEAPVDARAATELADRQMPAAAPPARQRAAEPPAGVVENEMALADAGPPAGREERRDESSAPGSATSAGQPMAVGGVLESTDATDAPAELRVAEAAPQGARAAALEAASAAAAGAQNARAAQPRAQSPQPSAPGLEPPAPSLEPPAEILSPDPSSRWRIGARGTIEYSADGGSSWEASTSGTGADLTAGTAPAATVCWIVGREGTVLLTTDGRRWESLAFPVSVDLVAVQAADARNATVSTADGRQFATADGGMTWR